MIKKYHDSVLVSTTRAIDYAKIYHIKLDVRPGDAIYNLRLGDIEEITFDPESKDIAYTVRERKDNEDQSRA